MMTPTENIYYEISDEWVDNCRRPIADCKPTAVVVDEVNCPAHYTSHPSGIECIEVTRHMTFNLGNVFKYIWRADLKNNGKDRVKDLRKALVYLTDELDRLTKK